MADENVELARRWLVHMRHVRDRQETLDIDLDDALMEFMLTDIDPERGWEIVVALFQLAGTERDIRVIAAGPLESLLREHGELLVGRVERVARTDSRFREALRGIYRNGPIADLVARLPP
jgi:hypothetical protein